MSDLDITFGPSGLGDLPDEITGTRSFGASPGNGANPGVGSPAPETVPRQPVPLSSEDLHITNAAQLRRIAAEGTLRGNMYVQGSWFHSCYDAARVCGDRSVPKSPFLLPDSERCSGCGDLCKCTKKNVLKLLEDTPDAVREYSNRLAAVGILSQDASCNTLSDIEFDISCRLSIQPEGHARTYDAGWPSRTPVPAVGTPESLSHALQAVAESRKAAQAALDVTISDRELLPVTRALAARLCGRTPVTLVKEEFSGRYPGMLALAWSRLAQALDPSIVISHRAAVPTLYGACKDLQRAVHAHELVPQSVVRAAECSTCIYAHEHGDGCTLLGLAFVATDALSAEGVRAAIRQLSSDGDLNPADRDDLLRDVHVHPRVSLRQAAARALAGSNQLCQIRRQASRSDGTGESPDLAGVLDPVQWAQQSVATATPLAQIRAGLRARGADSERELCESILSLAPIVHAAALDDCRDAERHSPHGSLVVPAEKCDRCPHKHAVGCLGLGRIFTSATIAGRGNAGDTGDDWYREITAGMNTELDATPLARADRPLLDVQMATGGEEMPVDIGRAPSRSITVDQRFFAGAELPVEVPPERASLPEVQIELGGSTEGMDAFLSG